MEKSTVIDGQILVDDKKELFAKTWRPVGEIQAYCVFLHGWSDHSSRYEHFFPTLARRGIEVRSFDQRGWGRSISDPAETGVTGPTSQAMKDITAFIRSVIASRRHPSVPIFLLGHSYGGTQVLTYAAVGPATVKSCIRGYICEGAYIGLPPEIKPWPIVVTATKLVAKVIPHFKYFVQLNMDHVSRDPAAGQSLVTDPYCPRTGTLESIVNMLDQGADLESGKAMISPDAGEGNKVSLLVAQGGEDRVCGIEATKRMFALLDDKIVDKELRFYDGWYHQLHTDPEHITFANDVADWILARSGPELVLQSKG